jgi:ribosomal protein S18 acetylase RimI-like enzyme
MRRATGHLLDTMRHMPSLPSGYGTRRPVPADAAAVFALVAAHNTSVIGHADYTEDDIADELVEPGFDPQRDGWVVHDPGGKLVGWGWSCRKGDSDNVDVAVYTAPGEAAVDEWLWDVVQVRGRELAAEAGHPQVRLDVSIYREETGARQAAGRRGYEVAAVFNRLRIDHPAGEPVPFPQPPTGLEIRDGGFDDAVRRDAHAVYNAAFADHFGFAAETYDEWATRIAAASTHDWAMIHVAYEDGRPVAALRRSNSFVDSDRCGYVHVLAVHPHQQGRGLGRFLLHYAFAADAARGLEGTLLHVDTDPARPALRLYLSAGMRLIRVIEVWRRSDLLAHTR